MKKFIRSLRNFNVRFSLDGPRAQDGYWLITEIDFGSDYSCLDDSIRSTTFRKTQQYDTREQAVLAMISTDFEQLFFEWLRKVESRKLDKMSELMELFSGDHPKGDE